jgi:hypothetical protein
MIKKQPQVYLAARYTRREELAKYRDELRAMGVNVQARWLDGKHQLSNEGSPIGDLGESLIEGDGDVSTNVKNAELRAKFATDDWEDVRSASIVINFTELPRSGASRGGRHVECGIGMASGARVIVVGHRENIFHWLPWIEFYPTWEEAKKALCQMERYTAALERIRDYPVCMEPVGAAYEMQDIAHDALEGK